jgi:hypothetical protein
VHARAVVQDPNGTVSEVKLFWGTDGVSFPNVINMASQTADTFATTSGIPPAILGSRIYLRIMAVDNVSDTTWTERIVYQIHETEMCQAAGSAGTGSDYINRVSLTPGFSNSSAQTPYSDFRSLLYTDVIHGNTYSLAARLRSVFSPDSMYAWADWNNNNIFEETERISMSSFNASNESIGTFTVPQNAVLDTVTLRVRNIYTTGLHIADPCNNYFGEVEDYSLVVNSAPLEFGEEVTEGTETELASSVYPNPTTGLLTIQHPEPRHYVIHVFDVFGKTVRQISHEKETSQTSIDLGTLPEGVYFLNIADGHITQTIKIMKQ